MQRAHRPLEANLGWGYSHLRKESGIWAESQSFLPCSIRTVHTEGIRGYWCMNEREYIWELQAVCYEAGDVSRGQMMKDLISRNNSYTILEVWRIKCISESYSSTILIFLGSIITADGDSSHEIKRCLPLGRIAMSNLDSVLKSRDTTLPTKVHIVKAMVFPVVMCRCESWTRKKAESWRIDAF